MKECCKTGNEKPENEKWKKFLKIFIWVAILAISVYATIQSFKK